MATYEITFKIDVPETKAGKPTAKGKRIADEWSDKVSGAFERITCSDELEGADYYATVFEGWAGPDKLEQIAQVLYDAGAGGNHVLQDVETLAAAWNELHRELKDSPGAAAIQRERLRQIHSEDYSADHDDDHDLAEITSAAIAYVIFAWSQTNRYCGWTPDQVEEQTLEEWWPWDSRFWKPDESAARNLTKAGALIAAEIDRLERAKVGETIGS